MIVGLAVEVSLELGRIPGLTDDRQVFGGVVDLLDEPVGSVAPGRVPADVVLESRVDAAGDLDRGAGALVVPRARLERFGGRSLGNIETVPLEIILGERRRATPPSTRAASPFRRWERTFPSGPAVSSR